MNEGRFFIIDDLGNEKEMSILFIFNEEDSNEDYVVYTDYLKDENGNINIYSNRYEIIEEKLKLFSVENKEIQQFIEEKLQEIRNQILSEEE